MRAFYSVFFDSVENDVGLRHKYVHKYLILIRPSHQAAKKLEKLRWAYSWTKVRISAVRLNTAVDSPTTSDKVR